MPILFKKENNKGSITVEASISLVLFLMFVLFLFSFARIYKAQNLVSHATIEAADSVALESYLRETAFTGDAEDVLHLTSYITESTTLTADNLKSLRSFSQTEISNLVKEKFVSAIAATESEADNKLQSLGVKNGLSGIDFSSSYVDYHNDDIIVITNYTVEMQFGFFGADEIAVSKTAKAKTFGEILFEVSTKPNVEGWGTTKGDNKVTHNTDVSIEAVPSYGYKFVKWNDGNTDNPRVVTVTDACEYTAIFEKENIGVNLSVVIKNEEYSTIPYLNLMTELKKGLVGSGTYKYKDTVTLSYNPSDVLKEEYRNNYDFKGWDINNDGEVDCGPSYTFTVESIDDGKYNYKAIFKPKKYSILALSSDNALGSAYANKNSAEYGAIVVFTGIPVSESIGKFLKWNNENSNPIISHVVTGPTTFTAIFEYCKYQVNVISDNNGSVSGGGTYYYGNKASISATPNDGYVFDYWTLNGLKTTLPAIKEVTVNASANYKAYFKKSTVTVTLNLNGGKLEGDSKGKKYSVAYNGNYSLPDPLPYKENYTFNGWEYKYNGNTKTQKTGKINNIKSNITLTAKWKAGCQHVQGRCGIPHDCDNMNLNTGVKNVTQFQCIICVKCGAVLDATGKIPSKNKTIDEYYTYNGKKITTAWWVYKYNGDKNKEKWNKKPDARQYGIYVH